MTGSDPRRKLPRTDDLAVVLGVDFPLLPRRLVVDAVRKALSLARRRGFDPVAEARRILETHERARPQRVINATGVILHTNLGRAPLSRSALAAVNEAASGYTNLEINLETGRRGDRQIYVESLLSLVTGAQSCVVVNNNAAAVMLICAALCGGREAIVSRGELVEIGGSFRIPEVISAAGATLREVGTTNRTHLRDYERAVGENSGLLLRVHPSNYRISGFTSAVQLEDLVSLSRRVRVPLVVDAGSGLVGASWEDEPEVRRTISAGVDFVCFSGDKLLGGPQAGIICGRKNLVDQIRTHPLMRPLRPDKMTLAALGATVASHLDGHLDDIPVWRMVSADDLVRRCNTLTKRARGLGYDASVMPGESMTGGGSVPELGLPGPVIAISGSGASGLAARLRDHRVIARVENRRVILDLRTVASNDDRVVVAALKSSVVTLSGGKP